MHACTHATAPPSQLLPANIHPTCPSLPHCNTHQLHPCTRAGVANQLELDATAGTTALLYINLRTAANAPVSSAAGSYDPLLAVSCNSFFMGPSGSQLSSAGSWCGQGPLLTSQGSGTYLVTLQPQAFP